MSHKIPSTLFTSQGSSGFTIIADVASISVSAAFSLLGDGSVCSTFTSGSAVVFITGTASGQSLIVYADSGEASPLGGILNFVAPPSNRFAKILAGSNLVEVSSEIVPSILGGTGQVFLEENSLIYGQGTAPVGLVSNGTDGQLLIGSASGPPKFATITSTGGSLTFSNGPNSLNMEATGRGISILNIISINNGGTGRTILTSHGVLVGAGSLPINVTAAGTNGQALIAATGMDPKFSTITSSGGTVTFTLGPNSLSLDVNWSASSFFNPLPVHLGGTGRTILTTYGVLVGEGSNPVNVTSAGTNGQVLIASSGADPAFATITSNTLSFTRGPNFLNIDVNFAQVSFSLATFEVESGGTGRTFLTFHGVLIGEGSNGVNVTAAGTDGQVLLASSTGDPKFSTITSTGGTITFSFGRNSLNIDINLNNSFFSKIEPGRGGTGQTNLTLFGVLLGEGSLGIHTTSAGTNGQVLLASSTGDPKFSTITSTGNSLIFTSGPNSLNIEVNTNSSFLNPLNVENGGTGRTVLTSYGVILGAGSLPVSVTQAGTNGQALIASTTGDPKFSTLSSSGQTLTFTFGPNALNIDLNLSNLTFLDFFAVGRGGTGRTVLTTHGVLIGQGSLAVNVIPIGTDGQVLIAANAADPKFATITSSGLTLTFFYGPNFLSINSISVTGLFFTTNNGVATPNNGFVAVLGVDPVISTGTAGILTIELNTNRSFFNPLEVNYGGLGQTFLTVHGVLIGEGSLPVHVSAAGTDGQTLIAATGADPAFATIISGAGTLSFTAGPNSLNIDVNVAGIPLFNPLSVANGGTGETLLTNYGVLIGKGSLPLHVTAPGTNGQTLIAATGADPIFATILSSTLSFTPGPNSLNIDVNLSAITFFNPLQVNNGGLGGSLLTMYGVLIGGGSLPVRVSAAGTDGQAFLAATGADPAFGTITSTGGTLTFAFGPNSLNIDVNLSSTVFNPLIVENGSTGQTTLTTYGVLIGAGSLPVHVTAPGTDGQALIAATGANPAFATLTSFGSTLSFTAGRNSLNLDVNFSSSIFTPVQVENGGTGQTVLTVNGVLIGEGSLDVQVSLPGTNGQALIAATGAEPAFATIQSPTGTLTFVTGSNSLNIDVNFNSTFFSPIPVIAGGTGRTLLTTSGVLVGAGTLPIDVTTRGTDGQALIAATGANPAFAALTSPAGTITFSTGLNSLNLDINLDSLPNPLEVTSGGTGQTLLTPYAVLCGGTAPTSPLQSVFPIGSNGQVLTSNGPGVLPSFQNVSGGGSAFTTITVRVFSTPGGPFIYTPGSGMSYCTIQCVGGGGSGGGFPASNIALGGGGGAGGFAQGTFLPADIGASQPVFVGIGGTATAGTGTSGGNSFVGASLAASLIQATGGSGGSFGFATARRLLYAFGGTGGIGSKGSINAPGGAGGLGWGVHDLDLSEQNNCISGVGGNSFWGAGGAQVTTSRTTLTPGTAGKAGTGNGAGGSGASAINIAASNLLGGAGAPGIVIITEYS